MAKETGQIIRGCTLSDIAQVGTRFKHDNGFLDVNAIISRAGIYEYQAGELGLIDRDAAQVVRVLRTDDEVFNEQSMQSFAQKPITNDHPTQMVDSSNSRFYNVGLSDKTIIRDGDNVATKLLITDKKAVEMIEAGKVELSCGYIADIVIGAGTDKKFGGYDAVQKNIRGNHIAIVEKGRAGDACKIKDKTFQDKDKGVNKMNRIFDGIQIEVTDQGSQAIDKLEGKLTDSQTALTDATATHKADIEKLTTDNKAAVDKLQGELDGAKSEILTDEQLDVKVAERASIVDAAKKIVKDFDAKGKSNADIKKAVVQAKHTDMKLDDKSADYIDGLFSGVTTAFSKGSDNLDGLLIGDKDDDPEKDEIEEARQGLIKGNKKKNEKETE